MAEEMDLKKFITMCEEHGGEYNKHRELDEEVHECEFKHFDDYEAFITWSKRHEVKKPNIIYRAEWDLTENGYYYKSSFEISRGEKQIDYYTEKSIASPDMLFADIPEEKALDFDIKDMREVIKRAEEEARKKIDEIEPPYIRDITNVGIAFDSNYDYYYTYSHAIYREPSIHSALLNDMKKATGWLVDEAEDAFYTEFQKKIGD